ncbi:hypothetical protein [Streptomyces sp. NPDC059008]|uniref:hypothetical protein n=1 Tax=unclassified Streptomyces TaxID=2593676 RepID=UPI0036AFA4B3
MFSRKKIAAVSVLLSGLAVTGAGATQAYAAATPSDCTRTAQGITCMHKSQSVYTNKDGKRIVRQTHECSSNSRHILVLPRIGVLNEAPQTTRVGPVMSCSNKVPPSKDFKEDSRNVRVHPAAPRNRNEEGLVQLIARRLL